MWPTWAFAAEAIVIVTTNTITILTFTRTPRLRMRKYSLIVNLAVADLFVGLIAVPLQIIYLFNQNAVYARVVYRISLLLDPFLGIASLFGLAAIAIERTYATYYPFKHRTMSKTPYTIGIAVVWLTAMLFASTIAFFFRGGTLKNMIIVFTGITIPLFIIICAYFLIWVKFTCIRNVLGHVIHQRNRKLSVTLAIVTIVSLIAWVPFMAIQMYVRFCYKCRADVTAVLHICKVLHYGNSFVNFIIYTLRHPEFRAGMAQMLRRLNCHCPDTENVVQRNSIELENRAVGHINEIHVNDREDNM